MEKPTKVKPEIATIESTVFCKALCSEYGKCQNVTQDDKLVAPCSWKDLSSVKLFNKQQGS